ncbi:MAG: YchJ family protein [Pseudomonadota bacterium]|nr:YchJ family protein [Pseudomonadota bacterium]
MIACPCQSGQHYAQCCQPLHQGTRAEHAEHLMRSRYSAYSMGRIDYIVATTLPIQQAHLAREAIEQWSQSSQWQGLTVHQHQLGHDADHAWVEFTAHWQDSSGQHQHRERSAFVRVDGQWYFIDPNHPLHTGRNDPCPCGRPAKFKKCCANMQ